MIIPSNIGMLAQSLDPEGVQREAAKLHKTAQGVKTTGEHVNSAWVHGLNPAVYTAPEGDRLRQATLPVQTESAQFGDQLWKVADALDAYAAEIQPIKARLLTLFSEANAFCAKADPIGADLDKHPDLVKENNRLESEVRTQAIALAAAEERCAGRIYAVYGGHELRLCRPGDNQPGVPLWGTPEKADEPLYMDVWHGVKSFGLGIWDVTWGNIASLTGLKGWNNLTESWEGMGKMALASLVVSIPGAWVLLAVPQVRHFFWKTNKDAAKGFLAWDEWKRDPSRAGGRVFGNLLMMLSLKKTGAPAAGAVGRGVEWAARGGRALDPFNALSKGAGGALGIARNLRNGDLGLSRPRLDADLPEVDAPTPNTAPHAGPGDFHALGEIDGPNGTKPKIGVDAKTPHEYSPSARNGQPHPDETSPANGHHHLEHVDGRRPNREMVPAGARPGHDPGSVNDGRPPENRTTHNRDSPPNAHSRGGSGADGHDPVRGGAKGPADQDALTSDRRAEHPSADSDRPSSARDRHPSSHSGQERPDHAGTGHETDPSRGGPPRNHGPQDGPSTGGHETGHHGPESSHSSGPVDPAHPEPAYSPEQLAELHRLQDQIRALAERHGVHVDYSTHPIDPANAAKINEALERLGREYPGVFDGMDQVKVQSLDEMMQTNPRAARALGYSIHDGEVFRDLVTPPKGIYLNQEFFADRGATVQRANEDAARGWQVPGSGTAEGTIYHEFGHQIGKQLLANPQFRNELAGELRRLGIPVDPDTLSPGIPGGREAVRAGLSKYAATKPSEMLAEGFAEWKLSTNPRPIASAIGSIMDKYFKGR
ncbi:hypothetical protein [Actinomadura rupiterrae]|uniref:hypothetical protein n=1 Tax=Actinomadura rupiterrae TaxID=559627 RepID=UPI0020A2EAFD|nr:hypothetical protein [Actinomadura rupiterrae]MCP2337579.1 hypothetical protein [Actinomadura rupiterrae]